MPSLQRFRLVLIPMLLLPGAAAAGVWEPAGPEGGNVPSLVFDPSDSHVLYASASFGGVFKSLDSGADWSRAGEGLQGADVASLAPDSGHPGTIYAGTSKGVFRSDDGGASWPVHGTGLHPGTANALLVTPDAVYADVVLDSGPIAPPRALYKSTDRGETWSPLSLSTVAALALDSADPHRLYAGTRGAGVLHSTNGGVSWTGAAQGLPAQAFVNALAILPGAVYTAIEGHGVFLSTDGGNRWRGVSRGLGGLDVVALAAGPAPSTLYAVTKAGFSSPSLFRTTDGGAHWLRAGPGLPADFLTLAADPQGGAVYAGTGSGVLRSLDAGATWSAANHGLRAVPAESVLADPQRPGIAYVTSLGLATPADPGSGLQKTVNGGAGWNRISAIGGNPFLFAIDPQRPATLYLSNGALQRSRNGGRTWASLGPDTTLLAIDPGQPAVLYRAQSGRIDRSADGGATWKTELTLPCQVISLTVSPSSEVFAGIVPCTGLAQAPVWRGVDGSWAPAAIELPSGALVQQAYVAADPRRPSTVYASVFLISPDPAVNGSFGETFRSTDGGLAWTAVADPSDGLATVFAFPPGEPGALYASYISPAGVGTDVYRSDDGGQSWASAGPGLAGQQVFSLSAGAGIPVPLYAATPGGLYKLASDPP